MSRRFVEIAALCAASWGCSSGKPCEACNVNSSGTSCQEGCLHDDGGCAANGVHINEGQTCFQTNSFTGFCVDGGCCVRRCFVAVPCATNPNPCWTGEEPCNAANCPDGRCLDKAPRPDGTACDGGTCRDGGCGP